MSARRLKPDACFGEAQDCSRCFADLAPHGIIGQSRTTHGIAVIRKRPAAMSASAALQSSGRFVNRLAGTRLANRFGQLETTSKAQLDELYRATARARFHFS
jgi:hypothetical protein